jgi:signal transduction histidine kinase
VKDTEQRKKFSHIIARESQRLSHLIENVLDFSRIETDRKEYSFEQTDIVKIVSNTIEAYRFHLREEGFEFSVSIPDKPILMSIDKDAISQAVLNLLNNAEKYSQDHKFISVEMTQKENEVWITVEDRGTGIPESIRKNIFDKFFRGQHSTVQEIQGSGLGLTIVEHIVNNHEGEVLLESEEGKGSRFTIKLPIKGIS